MAGTPSEYLSLVNTGGDFNFAQYTGGGGSPGSDCERRTTTTIRGLLSSIARERNQITGFILQQYDGGPSENVTNQGPGLNTCPNPASQWTLTTPAGDPELVSQTTSLDVSNDDGNTWTPLLEKP